MYAEFNVIDISAAFVGGAFIAAVLQRMALNNKLAAMALELRHRAEPDEPETTTVDEPADEGALTGRTRWVNGGMDAAVAMRERRRVLHLSTQEIEIHAAAVAANTDWSAVERALSGEPAPDDVPPLFRETRALLTPTGAYPIVGTHPDGPGSDDNTIPVKPLNKHAKSRKKHAHGGVR